MRCDERVCVASSWIDACTCMLTYFLNILLWHFVVVVSLLCVFLFSSPFFTFVLKLFVTVYVRFSLLKLFTWFIGTIFEKFSSHFRVPFRSIPHRHWMYAFTFFVLPDFMCYCYKVIFFMCHTLWSHVRECFLFVFWLLSICNQMYRWFHLFVLFFSHIFEQHEIFASLKVILNSDWKFSTTETLQLQLQR